MPTRLPLPSRIMAVQYRVFDRVRHPAANAIAHERGTAADFASLAGSRQCLVVTFRRSGEPVATPVNFGLSADGRLLFRSEPHVAKVARLRRDPHVRVCACSVRGKPRGPLVEATARVLPEEDASWAYPIVAANWDPATAIIERGYDRIGVPMAYVELTPGAPAA